MLTEYIWPKNQKVAVLNDCIYKNLARILTRMINGVEFFNGSISIQEDGFTVKLTATLLVYRAGVPPGVETGSGITDVVPVWCECEVMENGKIVANEFSWSEFKKFLPGGYACI